MRYCFGAAYIFTVLHQGFGMGLDERVLLYTNTLRDARSGAEVGLSWVVGAMLVEAMGTEEQHMHGSLRFSLQRSTRLEAHGAPLLLLALPLVGFVAAVAMLIMRWGT